ncbi:MAG TPA: hypothetical protein PLJ62_10140 [Thermoflexales bacterium]|nr:hypothetical protein [Thermoflexales bacterium]
MHQQTSTHIPFLPPLAMRLALVIGLLVTLTLAIWAGLLRMGWALPALSSDMVMGHGSLMIAGVAGTLIALERAVALQRRWVFLAPALSAAGAILLMLGAPAFLSAILFLMGSAVYVAASALMVKLVPDRYVQVMGLGAVCLLIGNALRLVNLPVPVSVAWWMTFLILTVAGERLELGRLAKLPHVADALFWVPIGLLGLGCVLSLFAHDAGARALGAGELVLAAWLLRFDIARKTIRRDGTPRFSAISLMTGYVWLGVSGILQMAGGGALSGLLYDAQLHALFVGFLFSMIFGHAPIIAPTLAGVWVSNVRRLYVPLGLLHFSLVLRVMGDLLPDGLLRQWGGMLNAVALLLFLVLFVASRNKK